MDRASSTPNNLPIPLTSFIGREREIAEVRGLLDGTRLLTLTGAGGCGKSRLGLQVARRVSSEEPRRFPDGVWLIELATVSDSGLVPHAVAAALGVLEQQGRALSDRLADYLRSKSLLLVLDNSEHLLGACAQLADTLLRVCEGLRFLTTSQERLGVPGEMLWRVPSLSIPDVGRWSAHEQLLQYEAVRLFVERAAASQPEFRLTQANARGVAEVCARLDGIPLAIELAAARVKALTVEQIAARLDDRFGLLTGGGRTVLTRHRTLRATMDWSYDLLSAQERTVLDRLSVFSGGWTLEAAEGVCARERDEAAEILDVLTSLVDKSLVMMEPRGGEARYHLSETVRQYGRNRLRESGDHHAFHRRHRDWYGNLSAQAEPELRGSRQRAWLARLEADDDNLRAALRWSLDSGEADAALPMAVALQAFWQRQGHLAEGRQWLEEGLRRGDPAPAVRIRALNALGNLAFFQADFGTVRMALTKSLALSREHGDTQGIIVALACMGGAAVFQGEFGDARSLLEESLAIARQSGDQRGIGTSLGHLGLAAVDRGDYAAARVLYQEALGVFRALGDTTVCATLLHNLGHAMSSQGEHAAARALFEESLDLARGLGFKHGIAHYTGNLAVVAVHEADFAEARALLEESLTTFKALGDKRGICRALEGFGMLAAAQGDAVCAARVLGASESLRHAISAPLPVSDRAHYQYDRYVTSACAALGEEAFAAAWAEGTAMSPEHAIDCALAMAPARPLSVAGPPAMAPVRAWRDAGATGLTVREREVACLVAQGLTNRDIAARLVISERTAEGHVQSILNKLGVNSRAQIAAWAVASGLHTVS